MFEYCEAENILQYVLVYQLSHITNESVRSTLINLCFLQIYKKSNWHKANNLIFVLLLFEAVFSLHKKVCLKNLKWRKKGVNHNDHMSLGRFKCYTYTYPDTFKPVHKDVLYLFGTVWKDFKITYFWKENYPEQVPCGRWSVRMWDCDCICGLVVTMLII